MDFTALHDNVLADAELQNIVDMHVDFLENPPVLGFHGAKCEGLTNATDSCNFIADGANLCAQKHSAHWTNFTYCMYSVADPDGDHDKDTANPLAHSSSMPDQLTKCSAFTPDYSADALKACTFGDEAAALRKSSAAKTPDSDFKGPQWVFVNDKMIAAPMGKSSRADWAASVVKEVCAAYSGPKPAACS